jgi:hypothetical protein
MPYVARHSWLLAAALALAGCGNAQPGNDADMVEANLDDLNAMATDVPSEADNRIYPGSNAVAGDVIPGQEVMFTGEGLGVAMIGLHLGQHYAFGRPRWEIVAMATNVRGAPTGSGTQANCREGPIDYVDFRNLRVNFQQDRFVGWDAAPGDPPVRDEWNFHIGNPRDDITAFGTEIRYRRTRRGFEFDAGGLRGLLSSGRPDAIVTDLWAGVTCTPR